MAAWLATEPATCCCGPLLLGLVPLRVGQVFVVVDVVVVVVVVGFEVDRNRAVFKCFQCGFDFRVVVLGPFQDRFIRFVREGFSARC